MDNDFGLSAAASFAGMSRRAKRSSNVSGRGWWIASAACHVLFAVCFAVGVWASVHHVQQVAAHGNAQPHPSEYADGTLVIALAMCGVIALCLGAVAAVVVGLVLTCGGRPAGPVMLFFVGVPGFMAAACSFGEFFDSEQGLIPQLLGLLMVASVPASIIVGALALKYPRPPDRQADRPVPMPSPSVGGSPYVRPPGS